MAYTAVSIPIYPVTSATIDISKEQNVLCRSQSSKDLCKHARIQRSCSENHLCYSINRVQAIMVEPKLKSSRSMGIFPFQFSGSIRLNSLSSFLYNFNPETSKELDPDMTHNSEKYEDCDCDEEQGFCTVNYEDEEDDGHEVTYDPDSFSKFLVQVPLCDTKLFSQLAFLCNMADAIQQIKPTDLERYYGLQFITSSLENKSEVTKMKGIQPSVAYEIAASVTSYVQSRTKALLNLASKLQQKGDTMDSQEIGASPGDAAEGTPRVYESEVAAYVAASTMTAVVAAGGKKKQEAAKDLQSPHSSPCEWFVVDKSSTCTRCFVIQGSNSLASWQTYLFFEPTKFEGTDVIVHHGIYEAAKGIYEQFMPEIMDHLEKYGDQAKLQFTGHSIGGSLSLLVHLMLLTRNVVKPSTLRPVVTFGSPFVFCGGQKILSVLGLDQTHIHCVIMHRDIVPRVFSCNYPNHVAAVLERLNSTFRSHPCLMNKKQLYSPLGKIFILQPDEETSPSHPLLPSGSGLYALDNTKCGYSPSVLRRFLNCPHPLETLSDPTAYDSEGTILQDHDSSNYLKAINYVLRQNSKLLVHEVRKQIISQLWPLLSSPSPHSRAMNRA